ncbi:MAG: four helix bundle protein [Bacteroidales bacterium]|nr:four helix bundle protein [Bacteroidales bacterium]
MRIIQQKNNLSVWQESLDFLKGIYELTKIFPNEEKECLILKLRESAINIISGISKWKSQNLKKDKTQYLYFSLDNIIEIEALLLISHKLRYITKDQFDINNSGVQRIIIMLSELIRKVEHKEKLSEQNEN